MSDAEDQRREDVAATAASISEDANRIEAMEKEKLDLEPGDPRAERISREVERLGRRVTHKARIEHALQHDPGEPAGEPPSRSN